VRPFHGSPPFGIEALMRRVLHCDHCRAATPYSASEGMCGNGQAPALSTAGRHRGLHRYLPKRQLAQYDCNLIATNGSARSSWGRLRPSFLFVHCRSVGSEVTSNTSAIATDPNQVECAEVMIISAKNNRFVQANEPSMW